MTDNNKAARDQAPIQMTTDQAREYLIGFMEQHFTDKTFHRYIRADPVDARRLAGDFAWQMATALRRVTADQAPVQSVELANELREYAGPLESDSSYSCTLLHRAARHIEKLAAVPAAQEQAQSEGTFVYFRRASEFGPWLECEPCHVDAIRFSADAAPTPPAATPARELTSDTVKAIWEAVEKKWLAAMRRELDPKDAGDLTLQFAQAIAVHLATPQGERETEQKQGE